MSTKKSINLISVCGLAIGAALGSGFFLLPGIMAGRVGGDLSLYYLLAFVPLLPAVLCMIELSTAIPKSGGVYFILSRSLGPMIGTLAGMGIWLLMVCKVGFILIGIGLYLNLVFPEINSLVVSTIFLSFLTILNISGTGKITLLQNILVGLVLLSLGVLFVVCALNFNSDYLQVKKDISQSSMIEVSGILFMSYIGITKILGISGEIDDPEKNIKWGVFISGGVMLFILTVGSFLMTGAVPPDVFHDSETPIATAGVYLFGEPSLIFMVMIAVFAFLAAANSSFMSSTRYPEAMSEDGLLPSIFQKKNKLNKPYVSVFFTFIVTLIIIAFFDPIFLAKATGIFQFIIFVLICLAVIIIRESGIESYSPSFLTPFYPWTQIFGVLISLFYIFNMGLLTLAFACLLIFLSIAWYNYYGKKRTKVSAALFNFFAKVGSRQTVHVDRELRQILKEKGSKSWDMYNLIISEAEISQPASGYNFESIFKIASEKLSRRVGIPSSEIFTELMEGTRVGATPVTKGVALPHFRTESLELPILHIVQIPDGVEMSHVETVRAKKPEKIFAFFFLVSPVDNPSQHLRLLAGLASRIDSLNFPKKWLEISDHEEIKEHIMRKDSYFVIEVGQNTSFDWSGKNWGEVSIPGKSYPLWLKRMDQRVELFPETLIQNGDRITFIGNLETTKD